jgi:aldose 1-epimerase
VWSGASFLDGTITGKGSHQYPRRSGFTFETQHDPDSPNHPAFPSTIVRPGTPYRSQTVFTFGVTKQGRAVTMRRRQTPKWN